MLRGVRDATRKRILQRRAAFLAAAVSTTAGCGPCNPLVCLEPAIAPHADAGAHDAGAGGTDAGADAAPEGDAGR